MPRRLLRRGAVRLAAAAVAVGVVSVVLFVVCEVLPGDAVTARLGAAGSTEAVAAGRAELGLDRDPATRYASWLGDALRGDLGTSAVSGRPVTAVVGEALTASAPLVLTSTAAAVVGSLLLGLFAGTRAGRRADAVVSSVALVAVAVPPFVVAVSLVLLFSSHWHLLPAVSLLPPGGDPLARPEALVMPGLTLVVAATAWAVRPVRALVADADRAAHVEAARLAGVAERRVLTRHLMPSLLGPVVQVYAWLPVMLLGASVVVEQVFDYPGVGGLLVTAVRDNDVPLVEAVGLTLTAVAVGSMLAADLVAALVDPRAREAS